MVVLRLHATVARRIDVHLVPVPMLFTGSGLSSRSALGVGAFHAMQVGGCQLVRVANPRTTNT